MLILQRPVCNPFYLQDVFLNLTLYPSSFNITDITIQCCVFLQQSFSAEPYFSVTCWSSGDSRCAYRQDLQSPVLTYFPPCQHFAICGVLIRGVVTGKPYHSLECDICLSSLSGWAAKCRSLLQ
jgi:hypothetical protein